MKYQMCVREQNQNSFSVVSAKVCEVVHQLLRYHVEFAFKSSSISLEYFFTIFILYKFVLLYDDLDK